MPLGIFDMPIITKGTIHTLIKIFSYLVIYIMPLLTLYILWWHFNKYQSSFYSSLHLLYIAIDTLLLSYFLITTKVGKILSILLWISFTVTTLLQMVINNEERVLSLLYSNFPKLEDYTVKEFTKKYYPHLELSGEHLVKFDYNELMTLQSLYKSQQLALLQQSLNLKNRSFKYADFSNAIMIRANLSHTDLQGANLFHTVLSKAYLKVANLQNTDLRFAQLQGANFFGANLKEADLSGANLQYAIFFGTTLKNIILRNTYLYDTDLSKTNLQGVDLSGSNLQGANLSTSNLQGTNLLNTKLQGANLIYTELQGVYLHKTELQGAVLFKAKLQGVHSCKDSYYSFIERMYQNTNKDSNLTCISKTVLSKKRKEQLIKELNQIYNKDKEEYHYLKYAIEKIQKSTSAIPDLSDAETGSYTKEEAQKWIEKYNNYEEVNEKP